MRGIGALVLVAGTLQAEEPVRQPAATPGKEDTLKMTLRALALGRQAAVLQSRGRYREAQPLHEEILTICRKLRGEEHLETAHGYSNLAVNQYAQGKYREAEESFRKALAIYRKVRGEEHFETARTANNLALIQNALGKYAEAEMGLRKALTIYRKTLGEEHADTASAYNNLALIEYAQAKYTQAEADFRKALAIRRKALGEEHADTATSYNNLAGSQIVQGKFAEAEEGLRKALAIYRKTRGEEHAGTANGYGNLAANQLALGKYAEAEEGLCKALAIRRKALGEEHADTATSYHNLAANQRIQGKYAQAEEGSRQALAIRRKVLGEQHPDTASSYINLANAQQGQDKYAEADEGYRKALAILRKVHGEEHPATALSYNDLASNQDAQGKYAEAEESFRKALAIYRKTLGEEHPSTAQTYSSLAANLEEQAKYAEAEEALRTARAILRKTLGEEHLLTASSTYRLASNHYARGKYAEAEELARRAATSFARARLHIAASGLERATITSKDSPLPLLAAVLARNGKPEEAWQRFEESLSRGTLDDLSSRLRRSPAEQARQSQLTATLERLDKLLQKPTAVKEATAEQSKRHEELLGQLRQAQDELADFASQMEKKYGPVSGQVFSRQQIQKALPAEGALIGWLDIVGKARATDAGGDHWAVLLRSSGDPVWLKLEGSGEHGAWTSADTRLPDELRAALQSPRGKWQPLAERLRAQRLQPLARHLEGVRHLIVLPSTVLAGIPVEVLAQDRTVSYAHSGTMFAHLRQQKATTSKGLLVLADPVFETSAQENAQPLPSSGLLVTAVTPGSNAARVGLRPNDVLLSYNGVPLSRPADLTLVPASSTASSSIPAVVWRDGKKLPRPVQLAPGPLGAVLASEPAPQALAQQRRLTLRLAARGDDGQWQRLPGTRVEAASLQRLLHEDELTLLLDSEASEQKLHELAHSGELGKYRYLHLATHGEVDDRMPLRSAVILARDQLPDDRQREEMLLAGKTIPDGRLTAEEVLRRWSLHCELVTLSACQTALGKYEKGEGYVGFAQALVLSGSRSVCLSLWKVDDTATALLMERFYQNLLGKRDGLDRPLAKAAALTEAKAWLRSLPRAEAVQRAAVLSKGMPRGKGRKELPPLQVAPTPAADVRDNRPYEHPYYWAAFVLLGDPD